MNDIIIKYLTSTHSICKMCVIKDKCIILYTCTFAYEFLKEKKNGCVRFGFLLCVTFRWGVDCESKKKKMSERSLNSEHQRWFENYLLQAGRKKKLHKIESIGIGGKLILCSFARIEFFVNICLDHRQSNIWNRFKYDWK